MSNGTGNENNQPETVVDDPTLENNADPTPPTSGNGDGKPSSSDVDPNKLQMEINMLRNKLENSNSSDTDLIVQEMAKRDAIDDFLKENSDKYPDLERDDLMAATSEDELEEMAARQQRRIEDATQKKLQTIQQADAPELSPEERAQQLEKAKKDGDFENMVELTAPKNFL